jgi:hypothetical protein
MAEAAGLEPAHHLVNNQVPYQLGYASSRLWISDFGLRPLNPQSLIPDPHFKWAAWESNPLPLD